MYLFNVLPPGRHSYQFKCFFQIDINQQSDEAFVIRPQNELRGRFDCVVRFVIVVVRVHDIKDLRSVPLIFSVRDLRMRRVLFVKS